MLCPLISWWWIRHAPVLNHGGQLYGALDVPADTSDRAAFVALAARLPLDATWLVTPLQRTQQTWAALQSAFGRAPGDMLPPQEPDFAEQNFGAWQGLTHAEIHARRPDEAHRFWVAPASESPPGGESFATVTQRVARGIARWHETLGRGTHESQTIVSVAHGGSIRAAIALALSLDPETALRLSVDNLSLTRLDFFPADNTWRVGCVNAARAPKGRFPQTPQPNSTCEYHPDSPG